MAFAKKFLPNKFVSEFCPIDLVFRLCCGHFPWSAAKRSIHMLFATRHPSADDVHWRLFKVTNFEIQFRLDKFGFKWKIFSMLFAMRYRNRLLPHSHPSEHLCIRSLFEFMTAPNECLRRRVYNVTAMSFTPEELVNKLVKYVPELRVTYRPDSRQHIGKHVDLLQ